MALYIYRVHQVFLIEVQIEGCVLDITDVTILEFKNWIIDKSNTKGIMVAYHTSSIPLDRIEIYYCSISYNHSLEENQWCGHVNDPLIKIVNLVDHNDSSLFKAAYHFSIRLT